MKNTTGPKNIVMVVESWGNGGTETYVSELVNYVKKKSYKVRLVLLRQPANKKNISLDIRYVVTGFLGLFRMLHRNSSSVVHLHLYTSLLLVMLIVKFMRMPVVVTLHMPLSAWGLRQKIQWRAALLLANKVVVVSSASFDNITYDNVYPHPIPGAVNEKFFHCERSINREMFNIAAVGRLEIEKDWGTLIISLGSLSDGMKDNLVLHFYGSGSQELVLKRLANELEVQVVFHGHVEREELIRAFSHSNIAVLPSRFEGFGISAIEAMSAGVPTITSNFPSSSVFIENGKTGHIFPIGDANTLSNLIMWHIDHPDESEMIGESGKSFVSSHYSEGSVYEPYLAIYNSTFNRY